MKKCEESCKISQDYEFSSSITEGYTNELLLCKDTKVKCVYCGMSHWHDECQKFKTVQQRKSQIKGRCFICLSTQHFCRQCKER